MRSLSPPFQRQGHVFVWSQRYWEVHRFNSVRCNVEKLQEMKRLWAILASDSAFLSQTLMLLYNPVLFLCAVFLLESLKRQCDPGPSLANKNEPCSPAAWYHGENYPSQTGPCCVVSSGGPQTHCKVWAGLEFTVFLSPGIIDVHYCAWHFT